MGISGWRIGYIISTENVVQTVLKVNQHLITCAPQYCFALHEIFRRNYFMTLPQVRDVVEKRKRVEKMIADLGMVCQEAILFTFCQHSGLLELPGIFAEPTARGKISVVPGSLREIY